MDAPNPFGFMANGVEATEYFRPPQKKRMANLRCAADAKRMGPVNNVPILSGMAFQWRERNLDFSMKDDWAAQFLRGYGYIG